MKILFSKGKRTVFNKQLLKHIERRENNRVLSVLGDTDPCQLCSSFGNTLLHFAAEYGNIEFTAYLINLEMAVDVQNGCNKTPLMYAVDGKQEDTIKLLLEANANPFIPDIDGQCALERAFSNGKKNIVSLLLDRITTESLNKNIVFVQRALFHSNCPIYYFISLKNADVTRILLENGSPVDAKEPVRGETALHLAARRSDLENVKILMKFNADVNATRFDGLTPLACLQGNRDPCTDLSILEILLDAGAIVIDRTSRQLMVNKLLILGNKEIVRRVLQSSIDLEFQNQYGDTALHILVGNRQSDVMKEVQDLKLLTKVRSRNGSTILHTAAFDCRIRTIEYLLHNGADIYAEDEFGRTPLHQAIKRGAQPRLVPERILRIFTSRYENGLRLAGPILAHVTLTEASGTPIEESMLKEIKTSNSYKTIFESKKSKLHEMKHIMIGKSVTLYDFLIASHDQISMHARNPQLNINLTEVVEYFSEPYYCSKLKKHLIAYTELLDLRKKIAIAIDKLFNGFYNVTVYTVAEKISNYLEDRQIFKLSSTIL